jgi:hypothetical protein
MSDYYVKLKRIVICVSSSYLYIGMSEISACSQKERNRFWGSLMLLMTDIPYMMIHDIYFSLDLR